MTKILLVEDDKSLREIYGVRLLAEGYDIVSAGDGEEALAVAIRERPDLIVSDVMMPKISGFEMLDLLRGNEATKGIKVIMMTALSSDQQRERGESLGADRYLVKSQVGIEDVVRTVHEVLGDQTQGQSADAPAVNSPSDNTQPETNTPENPAAAASVFQPAESVVAPSTPAPNQSPINPPAATAPNEVAGVPAPVMPAEPMSVPPIATPPNAPTLPPIAPPTDGNPAPNNAVSEPAAPAPTATTTEQKEVPSFQPKENNDNDDKPTGEEHQPAVDLTQSGAGSGSRVIQPIGEGVSPKVNLENLLANEDAKSMGINPDNLVAQSNVSGDGVSIKTAEGTSAESPQLDEADISAQLADATAKVAPEPDNNEKPATPPANPEATIPPVGDNNTIVFPSQQ